MFRRTSKWIILVLAFSLPVASLAQDNFCRQLIDTALEAADEVCSPALRNQACYGHDMLEAQPQTGLDTFNFDEVGDIVDVAHIRTLSLSPMDLQNETWGVAMMNLQANLPDEMPNQNIKLLLFGDVAVRNIIETPRLVDVTLQSEGNANVRRLPDTQAFVIGTLPENASVTARGRSADNQWILVTMPDGEAEGWINSTLVSGYRGVLSLLSVVEPTMSEYGPMQAFYVRTGEDSTSCAEAPSDGLLIQTPEGVAEVRLWINQVKIRLGSTVFISANAGQGMTVSTLEGHASVEAMGVEYTAMAGTSVSVPMDNDDKPSAPPKPPKPIKQEEVDNLPVEHLERQITVEILPTATAQVLTATDAPTSTNMPATPAPTSTRPIVTEEPTVLDEVPSDIPVEEPSNTAAPPTDIPPTDVPPTDVPPTDVPPTAVPPTDVPPPAPTSSATEETQSGSSTSGSGGSEPNGGSSTSSTDNPPTTDEP